MHVPLGVSRGALPLGRRIVRSVLLLAGLPGVAGLMGISAQAIAQGSAAVDSTHSVNRPATRASEPAPMWGVPEALPDSTFWRLVNVLSEPAGWFRSENLVSNEVQWQHVIAPLQRLVPRERAYLGVGPEQNFTYIAALEPSIAFIVDVRRQNLALHLWYKALFELAETRADFLSMLFARPRPIGLDTSATADRLLDVCCGTAT